MPAWIHRGAAVLMLVTGGGVAAISVGPVKAMVVAIIVVAGAVQCWSSRGTPDEQRRAYDELIFLLGAALMLSGW
jgi:hypothetical protein